MSKPKFTAHVNFESIGKTDDLKTVSCLATNHSEVKYSSERTHLKDELVANNPNVWSGEHRMINSRFKRREDKNEGRERQYFSETRNVGYESKKSFWPTDLIQDETGETLRRLRSYIESHKINTYIKHDLPDLENEEEKEYKNHYKVAIEHDANKAKHQIHMSKRSFSENNKNKHRMLRIDYEVVTIKKEISPNKKKSFYPTTPGKSTQPKIATERDSSSKKFIKTSDIKVSPSLNKLHDSSPKASSMAKTHRTPLHSKLKSRDDFEENLVQCKALDVHERQYLTPNTSTYFQSLNNSIEIESESESPQKSRNKNYKSYINVDNEEEEENKSKSYVQKEAKTMQKLTNRSENYDEMSSNWKNKYKDLEANNYYDSHAKYKNIMNISNNA